MGIVVNQSIKNVIITCFGFGLGAINTLFLYTNFIEKEYYGLISYLTSTSNLIWPLIVFGGHNAIVKFYSSYVDKKQQDKFLSMMLFIPLLMALFLGSIGVVAYTYILDFFSKENTIVQPFVWTIYVLAIALSYFEIFFAWTKVKLKSVFGNILRELFIRICSTVLLLMVYFDRLTVEQFIYGIVIAYVFRMFIMMFYASKLHVFSFSFSLPNNYVTVLKYSFLILIAGSVGTLLIDLDKAMIERFLPIENVAKYSICAYVASVIIIPSRSMHQITYPLTAKLINEKNFKQLETLYKKSSLTLFMISGLLFVLIICNIHQLFKFIPEEYELFTGIVILIGGAKLFDNLLGNSNSILFNSDYYRLILYIGVMMVVLTVILNLFCIPIFGVTGAAIATFIAVSCYNLSKLWIVYIKFKMHPFTKSTLFMVIQIVVFVFAFYFWNFNFHPIINIIAKSFLIGVSYIILLYVCKISPDINDIIKKIPRGA